MKNILIIVIAIFLSACTLAEILPTSTPIPPTVTLPPTTTPLPTATVTPTAVPTVEEKAFHSCIDPELIAKVETDFTARTGIVLDNPTDQRSIDFATRISKMTPVGFEPTNMEVVFTSITESSLIMN